VRIIFRRRKPLGAARDTFRVLAKVDPPIQRDKDLRRFVAGIAVIDVARSQLQRILAAIMFPVVVLALGFPLVVVHRGIASRLSLSALTVEQAALASFLVAVLYLVAAWPTALPERWQHAVGAIPMISWMLSAVVVYGVVAFQYRYEWPHIALAAVLVICLFMLAVGVAVVSEYAERQQTKRLAVYAVARELLKAHERLNRGANPLQNLTERHRIVEHLEAARDIVSDIWPRRIGVRHSKTTDAIRHECERFGHRLDSMALAIAWPATNARQSVSREIGVIIQALQAGDAQGLSTSAEQASDERRTRTWPRLVTTVVFAVAPLSLLLAVRIAKLEVPSIVGPWLTVLAYVWAVVGILAAIDPNFEKRLSLIQSTMQLLRSGKSE
jgi:hypothetical protein